MSEAKVPAMTKEQEHTWAMLTHLSGFLGYVVPLSNILIPFLVWQMKKDQSSFLAEEAKSALNFQISITIYSVIAFVLVFLVIGLFLLFALMIFELVVILKAALAANKGEHYKYPLSIVFVK